MSNIVGFKRMQHSRCGSSPSATWPWDFDPDMASPSPAWHATAINEINNSVLMLDRAARQALPVVMQISDQRARQVLIGQIETIERLLQLARDMAQRL